MPFNNGVNKLVTKLASVVVPDGFVFIVIVPLSVVSCAPKLPVVVVAGPVLINFESLPVINPSLFIGSAIDVIASTPFVNPPIIVIKN
jgi:hypothetical protein